MTIRSHKIQRNELTSRQQRWQSMCTSTSPLHRLQRRQQSNENVQRQFQTKQRSNSTAIANVGVISDWHCCWQITMIEMVAKFMTKLHKMMLNNRVLLIVLMASSMVTPTTQTQSTQQSSLAMPQSSSSASSSLQSTQWSSSFFQPDQIHCPSLTDNPACPCYKFDDGNFIFNSSLCVPHVSNLTKEEKMSRK